MYKFKSWSTVVSSILVDFWISLLSWSMRFNFQWSAIFYKHFVLQGSVAMNLHTLEILIFILSTKIDTLEYQWNHSMFRDSPNAITLNRASVAALWYSGVVLYTLSSGVISENIRNLEKPIAFPWFTMAGLGKPYEWT